MASTATSLKILEDEVLSLKTRFDKMESQVDFLSASTQVLIQRVNGFELEVACPTERTSNAKHRDSRSRNSFQKTAKCLDEKCNVKLGSKGAKSQGGGGAGCGLGGRAGGLVSDAVSGSRASGACGAAGCGLGGGVASAGAEVAKSSREVAQRALGDISFLHNDSFHNHISQDANMLGTSRWASSSIVTMKCARILFLLMFLMCKHCSEVVAGAAYT